MARITVAYEAVQRGQFPPLCCKTGVHTDNYVRWRFVYSPRWTWVLLPFGIIPFIIARMFVTEEFDGVLPMSPKVVRRLNRLRLLTPIAGLLGIAGIVGGALVATTGLAVAGVVLLAIAALCLLAGTIMSPDCHRDLDRGAAELSSVHRRFVQTIEAAWEQAGQVP